MTCPKCGSKVVMARKGTGQGKVLYECLFCHNKFEVKK